MRWVGGGGRIVCCVGGWEGDDLGRNGQRFKNLVKPNLTASN